jgi:uncharacterized integral membrane protein (TIGR00697 family)
LAFVGGAGVNFLPRFADSGINVVVQPEDEIGTHITLNVGRFSSLTQAAVWQKFYARFLQREEMDMSERGLITDPTLASKQHFKYLDLIGMIWICCLMLSTFPASKIFDLGPFQFSVGVLIYPFTYIFADVFTEVYGYRQTRRIVWTGLLMLFFSSIVLRAMVGVTPSRDYTDQQAYEVVFGQSALLTLAVMMCFFCGEITNSYVLAKMKIRMNGKWLWARATLSTLAGQLIDNFIFYLVAFGLTGTFPPATLINLWLSTVAFCTIYEFVMTPLTYKICNFLKRAEGLDVYDRGTNFNPFSLSSDKEKHSKIAA